jgi:hypothetical protein
MRRTCLWLALVACGDDGSVDSDDPGTTDASTTSVDPSSSSSSSTGDQSSSSESGPSDASETAEPICPEDAAPEGPEVAFTIRNDRADAIFVTTPFSCADTFVRIDTEDATGRWPLDACAPACTLIVADACEPCPNECDRPTLLRIDAGATHEIVWDGALWIDHVLEQACNACGVAPDCLLGVSAPASTYLATATAASSASNCTRNGCECPAGESTCMLDGEVADPQELGAQLLFEYPDETTVDLVFDES